MPQNNKVKSTHYMKNVRGNRLKGFLTTGMSLHQMAISVIQPSTAVMRNDYFWALTWSMVFVYKRTNYFSKWPTFFVLLMFDSKINSLIIQKLRWQHCCQVCPFMVNKWNICIFPVREYIKNIHRETIDQIYFIHIIFIYNFWRKKYKNTISYKEKLSNSSSHFPVSYIHYLYGSYDNFPLYSFYILSVQDILIPHGIWLTT